MFLPLNGRPVRPGMRSGINPRRKRSSCAKPVKNFFCIFGEARQTMFRRSKRLALTGISASSGESDCELTGGVHTRRSEYGSLADFIGENSGSHVRLSVNRVRLANPEHGLVREPNRTCALSSGVESSASEEPKHGLEGP